MYPLYITVYNQMTWPRLMAIEAVRLGLRPIFLDNNSTNPIVMDWLRAEAEKEYEVLYRNKNYGCYGFWQTTKHRFEKTYYFVSDGDLDLSGCPGDTVAVMIQAFNANPGVVKAGLSLEINDVPTTWPLYDALHAWEDQYWTKRSPDGHWIAGVGATMAVYHPSRLFHTPPDPTFYNAVRTDRPYTARHLPWYLDFDSVDEEFRYYMSKLNPQSSVWTAAIKAEMEKRGQL